MQASNHAIDKQMPSAFFDTELDTMLTYEGFDACSQGYHPMVPKECVGDREPDLREANLFDIKSKYADVLSINDCLEAF